MGLLGVFEVSEYIVHVVGKEGGLLQIDCIDDPNYFSPCTYVLWGLPQWLSNKESTCNAGSKSDVGSIPGSERPPGGGHDNPLQYSCLENPHGHRSLVGFHLRGRTESDMIEAN